MRLRGAVGAQQLRQPDAGVQVALRAFADEVALTAKGHHVRFAEGSRSSGASSITSTAGTLHSRSASRMATL